MADTFRAPPHVLSALRALLSRPDASAVVQALNVAMAQRAQHTEQRAQAWTLADALEALDDPERATNLFGALRLLQAAQPDKASLGYSHRADEDPVRIDQALLLEFARTEVTQVEPALGTGAGNRPRLQQTAIGLLGPNGALPYAWTEHAHDLAHSPYRTERDNSFMAWINVIQRRQIGLLYRAWADTQAVVGVDRPNDPHPMADRLRALAGLAFAGLHARDRIAPGFKSAFAAVLSRRVRSPQPLAAMLAYHFDAPVRVEEFVARWLDIPSDQRTRLGVQFNTLGEDSVAGSRVWDCSTRFRIVIGPLSLTRYRQFLPHGPAYKELSDLVTMYVGVEFEWELVPELQAGEVPYSWLGNEGLLLGWSAWLGVRYEQDDAEDLGLQMAPVLARLQPPAGCATEPLGPTRDGVANKVRA